MRLIFLGDIAIAQPYGFSPQVVLNWPSVDLTLANLEGPIVSNEDLSSLRPNQSFALHNSLDVLSLFRKLNISAVYLANNHIFDLPLSIANTKESLRKEGITGFGAGVNFEEASSPFVYTKDNTTVKIFSFGWEVIGCKLASSNQQGVNPFTVEHTLKTIRNLRNSDRSSSVVFVIHWNYELELYPQPAHRQLAHDLIREGVDAIIGLHPHVAQGAELVDGKPVIYSLGNWFFPSRQLGQFHLKFPPVSGRELAVEVQSTGRRIEDVQFHWHQYDQERNLIEFEKTESWDGQILKSLTPFSGMGHSEYVEWFGRNRTRRRGLPVYKNYEDTWQNSLKDNLVKARQSIIKLLVSTRLKRKLS